MPIYFSLQNIVIDFFPLGTFPFTIYNPGLQEDDFYLIARHPIGIFTTFHPKAFLTIYLMELDTRRIYTNLVDPFDSTLWTCYGVSILVLTIVTIGTAWIYKHKVCSTVVRADFNLQFLTIRLLFGITEPDRIKIFSRSNYSLGCLSTIGTCYAKI